MVVLLGVIFASCKGKENPSKGVKWTKKQSTEFNKNIVIEEELQIRMFLANRKWKVQKTGSGLRYYIYKHGEGDSARADMHAEVRFKINQLDGTFCYQTDSLETETFRIDHSDVESGVQEGIKKMRVGDKAKLIIPSHLGHGLTGDMDKIPPLTVLVIDLELVSLKRNARK